ncbi:MAG: segregation/condensation protein A [Spirochaetaceae bacterium]|nr:segregation/condensation protein A [Spirochaetaceae bacterium]MDT8299246.1 segregation/condensation protein A [Spirochaetaceae bacterium]
MTDQPVLDETAETGKNPSYRLDHFEGPLDLLLFLIRKNEVNIYDIPVAEITQQYLDFLKYAAGVDLEGISEFYLMASTLLYIKSRMLLPVEVDLEDELEDPRQELVQRLIEYERFRKITDLMAEREAQADWIVERKQAQAVLPFPDEDDLWDKVDSWDLLKSFSKVMNGLGGERVISLWEEVSINEKITLIHEYLEDRSEFIFDDIIVNPGSLMEVVSAFLAVLELVKMGEIDVFQNRLFGDIKIIASDRAKEAVNGE